MRTPNLDEIAPELIDGMSPPPSFIASHLSVAEMGEQLGMDLDTLWLAVRDGLVPRPVYLPTNPLIACWNCGVVKDWVEAGMPRDEAHETHERIVFEHLLTAVRDELSPHPPTLAERN